jgi:NAD(P)-dependent dehydrogenase (short-subunit alcohol dehydrogenase family)
MRLAGKRTFISGAGGGIGRATALKFAAEGAAIACADINPDAAASTVAAVTAAGGTAFPIVADLSDEPACATAFTNIATALGGLDIVFNNAGVCLAGDAGPVETTLACWNATLAANLTSVFLCCKYALPLLKRGGVIINNASITALVGSAFPQIAYTAAKGGVLAMTRELAIMHARDNIRAIAICPGPVATPLVKAFLSDDDAWALRRRYMPMGRLGTPEEIANLVAFLASDEASYITGSAYTVDGGVTAAYVIDDR